MFYFAYGSNMSLPRLRQRVASAQPVSTAFLAGHRLVFHKVGRDGSAKCDAVACTDGTGLHGVLYRIARGDRPLLDACEGLGQGYDERRVTVLLPDGGTADAFLYVATRVDPALRPFAWYKQHVLHGARTHGLPAAHVAAIAAVLDQDDPDTARAARELAIYP